MAEVAVIDRPPGRLSSLAALYRAVIRTSIQGHLQYRINTLLESTLMLAEPLVYLMVWQIVAEEQGGAVDGYTPARFAAYYIAWTLVRTFTQVGSPLNWEYWIREGRMSALLMRPIHPVHQDAGFWIGFTMVRSLSWVPAGVVLTIAFRPDLSSSVLQLLVLPVALLLANLIRTLMMGALGATAFWLTRIAALASVYSMAEVILSGRLVPPELLPGWAQTLSWVLPFRWTFAFPIEVLIGPISAGALFAGLGIQLAWLVAAVLLVSVVWRRGVTRYGAVGG